MEVKKPKAGFCIGVTCPGCGGALELESDFFALTCRFCGSVLRVVMPDLPPAFLIPAKKQKMEIRFLVDRYLKENGLPLTRSDFKLRGLYYPYWKIEAVLLKVRDKQPEPIVSSDDALSDDIGLGGLFSLGGDDSASTPMTRIEDRTPKVMLTPQSSTHAAGPTMADIPETIGLRAEYVRMVPFSAEQVSDAFEYAPATVDWPQMLVELGKGIRFKTTLDTMTSRHNRTELFHPTGVIVYFPYFLCETGTEGGTRRLVLDGLSGRVVHDDIGPCLEAASQDTTGANATFGILKVELHRCPNCGVDLPMTESCVYICHNCHWVVSLEKNHRLQGGMQTARDKTGPHDTLFPFWLIRVPSTDIGKMVTTPTGEPPTRLAVPAFKISNFEVMRRLCKRMTTALTKIATRPVETDDPRFLPVTVSLTEAITLAEVTIYCEQTINKLGSAPPPVVLLPQEIGLFYAPFHPENYFYVDSMLGAVTFEKGAFDKPAPVIS